MKILKTLLASAAVIGLASTAHAGVIYTNPLSAAIDFGDCSFNNVCAAAFARGDDFAAQLFHLNGAAIITDASFSDLDHGAGPTDATWAFIMADGAGGLPGTILAVGTDAITTNNSLGTDGFYSFMEHVFNIGTVALGPGDYYFAVQAITTNFSNYLAAGTTTTGAAETHDSGVSWAPGYEGIGGVAVTLYGTGNVGPGIPEPATWALMLAGFGAVGVALRRRTRTAALAA